MISFLKPLTVKVLMLLCACVMTVPALAQEAAMAAIAQSVGTPGMQVTHRKGGVAKSWSYGVKNIENGDSVNQHTLFQAASLTKVVAAYAFFRLLDQGLIDLDTPLWQYYPYDRLQHTPGKEKITARMVLTHRTGLLNWEGDVPSPRWRATALTLQFEPGTAYLYSGEGFYYLQETLAHISGKSFEELVRQEVLTPLGMDHSAIVWREELSTVAAHGHYSIDRMRNLGKYRQANAAYTLYTTAQDYSLFIEKALFKGEGLQTETHQQMVSAAAPAQRDVLPSAADSHVPCALGLRLQLNEAGTAYWHTGSNPGFRCFFIAYPDTGESLVVFMNSDTALPAMAQLLPLFIREPQTFWAYTWRLGELD